MRTAVGLIWWVAYFSRSLLLIKGGVYFNNDEYKAYARCALLLQGGTLLVSVNIKSAYALKTWLNLEPGWPYASWNLKLPNVKPTQDGSAPAAGQRKNSMHLRPGNLLLSYLFYCKMYCIESFQPVRVVKHIACRESKILEQKRTGLFQWKTSRDTENFKNHPWRLFRPRSIHTFQK